MESADSGNVVQYDITTNAFTAYAPPLHSISNPRVTIVGPDSNVWFTAVYPGSPSRMEIGVLVLRPIKVTPDTVTLSGPGAQQTLTVTQSGVTKWTATSSNAAIATVTQGPNGNEFVVTAAAAGKCNIVIADKSGNGNSAKIPVTVQ